MKRFLIFFVFGLVGCDIMSIIPGGDFNSGEQIPEIDPEQVKLNEAFLKNVAGNWTNHSATIMSPVVYTMTDDGHFFFTNSQNSGSFTLQTNGSFYAAQSEITAIFSNENKKFFGFRMKDGNLGVESKAYNIPNKANSSMGYVMYFRK
ncbi:hypothetical protein SAMN02745150_00969 [Brevinema andersonii]|uniref:Uncharacterized protein n=1 Tax=Brevinema andersonii TaxID=34097 RepID=A0A1I1E6H9_BREAD|nr:hypothetical protein [Brevinema andersonii]SFB82737.1 hypothetical protein SAMN02745150_00969 [Brevinema andersonii]